MPLTIGKDGFSLPLKLVRRSELLFLKGKARVR